MTAHWWLSLLLLIYSAGWAAAPEQAVDLTKSDWQYQWGDFAVNSPAFDNANNWQPIDFPANPADRQNRQFIWFKTTLPAANAQNPVIFITSVDLTVAAYLEGQKIYQFGEVTAEKQPVFRGWPWHSIPLPTDYAGKTLTLKVFSDYVDIGLWGDIWLIDRSVLQLTLLKNGIDELIIAAFCLLLALLALLFSTMRRNSHDFLYLGLFALATTGTLIGENLSVQLLIDAPLVKRYIAALSYFAMPVFLAMLLSYWCQQSDRRWFLVLAGFLSIYWLTALSLSLLGLVNLVVFYPIFDVLLLVSAVIMLLVARRHYPQLAGEQKLVMLALVLFAGFLFVDMLIAHGLLPWIDFPMSLGALLFTLIVAAVSLHHYKQLQDRLRQMNLQLEQRVTERTESLQAYADQEVARSQQLAQINSYSLGLEELISQLQKTADLATAGDLVCEQIPKIFAPRRMHIQLADNSALSVNDAANRHLIEVEDIQGREMPFIVVDCFENHEDDLSQSLMDEFISRVLARLRVTLSNIKLRESLQKMSFEDALTGLKNRRFFDEALQREQHIAMRNNTPLALLICDIDYFKAFNDRYGHDAGDMALRTLAGIMLEHFRETDIPCRFG
ncbi:MAG: diguanylate cyclase, partial [Methylophaga sp.]|nr:diguanylate cyclase [Methylophaga sp.]